MSTLGYTPLQFSVVAQSCDPLQPHALQHTRPSCPSPTPGAYSTHVHQVGDGHPTISSSVVPFSFSIFPSIRVFSNESALQIRWPEYWSFNFSISPSSEHSGLISFRVDWLDLLASPRDSQESSPTPQFKRINSSALSFLHSPTLTSIHDHRKDHILD